MGTQLSSIIHAKEISLLDLSNKRLVVDTYNMLYQFISIIRQQDGSPLMDSQGRTTSHLSGLFFRISKLLEHNIKLAFVFDGKAPALKNDERKRRAEIKADAQRKYEIAADEGDIELMKKYASRTSILTAEMINESKELISAFGQPIIQAPSEGEAQAAYMVKKGEFYASVSQDTDGLLFGCPRLIKNLSISRKRKKIGTSAYETVNPEVVDLSENLNLLSIDNEQLIVIGMLCGTDFNIGGIKGIGPKKALLLVNKHKKDFEALFKEAEWSNSFANDWQTIYNTIKNMPTIDNYDLAWGTVDQKRIFKLMVEKYEFSAERLEKSLEGLTKKQAQRGLGDFF